MHVHGTIDNQLTIGGVSAMDLVKKFGSPLYVYDESVIRESYRKLFTAIDYDKKRVHYAMKANSNLGVLKTLLEEGACIDAVSVGEALLALKAGFAPGKILLTGSHMTLEEMRIAADNKIPVNVGSLNNLETYGKNFPNTSVSIRVNPDFGAGHHSHVVTGGRDSKFGIFHGKSDHSDIEKAAAIIERYGLKLDGIHAHIGSGILDEKQYIELMKIILKLAEDFPGLEFIDFGGGIGVPYRPEEKDFDLAAFGAQVGKMMRDFNRHYGSEPFVAIEPGRFLVAEAGVLLVTVTDLKETPKFAFAGVDSGFNHLIRPMAYGSYHPIVNASRVTGTRKDVVISGYLCESGDVFTRGEHGPEAREMTAPEMGDVLAIMNAGAYGYAMSSNYNVRPRPAEVLVSGGKARLTRPRETIEQLLGSCE
jgi:diaminopimelate decarboxylase